MYFFELRETFRKTTPETTTAELQQAAIDAGFLVLEKSNNTFFMSYIKTLWGEQTFVIATADRAKVKTNVLKFFKAMRQSGGAWFLNEITFTRFVGLLDQKKSWLDSTTRIMLSQMNLLSLIDSSTHLPVVGDQMLPRRTVTAETKAANSLFSSTLAAEYARMDQSKNSLNKAPHPVHYVVRGGDNATRGQLLTDLLVGLRAKERLTTGRVTMMSMEQLVSRTDFNFDLLETIYRENLHGTVVVALYQIAAKYWEPWFESFASIVQKYRREVLTVFVTNTEMVIDTIFEKNFPEMTFVPIYQDATISKEQAQHYFQKQSVADGYFIFEAPSVTNLLGEQATYALDAVFAGYEKWHDQKRYHDDFPQYDHFQSNEEVKPTIVSSPGTISAYDKLQEMVGLTEVKKIIDSAIAVSRLQKLMVARGLPTAADTMHMVFTGNPGTAKTTVARLFGQIMKDFGILSKGDFYEVGRGDLVGQYVGHTAPKVQALFKKAAGSVLFIDEAYSLVDDRQGGFADEAINCIVQEMENHREDMIVIFAGYPKQMAEFVARNPGLASRLAYTIPFADYNSDELFQIAELDAKKRGFHLADDVKSKFFQLIETIYKRDPEHFGNGRTVRNMIDNAKRSVAESLDLDHFAAMTNEELTTLKAENFSLPACAKNTQTIGFFK